MQNSYSWRAQIYLYSACTFMNINGYTKKEQQRRRFFVFFSKDNGGFLLTLADILHYKDGVSIYPPLSHAKALYS